MAIITISRGTFSGGKQIAEGVAERLGFRCISMEILVKAAEDYGVPIDKLNDAIRKRPSLFDRLRLEKQHCVTVIKDELVRAVQNEDVVYHGLAGHLMLKELPHVLRVKVTADIESRIQAAMEADSLTHEQAERYIAKVDQERNRWVKYLYPEVPDWSRAPISAFPPRNRGYFSLNSQFYLLMCWHVNMPVKWSVSVALRGMMWYVS